LNPKTKSLILFELNEVCRDHLLSQVMYLDCRHTAINGNSLWIDGRSSKGNREDGNHRRRDPSFFETIRKVVTVTSEMNVSRIALDFKIEIALLLLIIVDLKRTFASLSAPLLCHFLVEKARVTRNHCNTDTNFHGLFAAKYHYS
jgi:hypothetical protein